MPTTVAPAGTAFTTTELEPTLAPVAHREGPEDLRARADHHAPPERGVALALVPGDAAQRDTVIKGAIVADLAPSRR